MERFFGRFNPEQFAAAQQTREFVSVKAGRCDVEEKSNNQLLIKPDKRKGQLMLLKHSDELTHLQWKDRLTNAVVEDVIVMPQDAVFTRVDTGRPKDRVYLLQFHGGSSRRLFFWMQEASDEKDEESVKKLNNGISGVSSDDPAEAATTANAGVSTSQQTNQNVEQLLSSMFGGQQQRQDNPTSASGQPAQVSSGAREGNNLTNADLQRAMMNMAGMQGGTQITPLSSVVTSDAVVRSGILSDPAVQEQLIPLLADGQQNSDQLEATIRSPQFRATLSSLTSALQTENFNSIMSNFGLDATPGLAALQRGNNVEAFLLALLALRVRQTGQDDEGKGQEETKEEGKSG